MDSDQKLLSTHCDFGTKLLIVQAREKRINTIKDYKKSYSYYRIKPHFFETQTTCIHIYNCFAVDVLQ